MAVAGTIAHQHPGELSGRTVFETLFHLIDVIHSEEDVEGPVDIGVECANPHRFHSRDALGRGDIRVRTVALLWVVLRPARAGRVLRSVIQFDDPNAGATQRTG